jgi:hypothetical protein
LSTTDPGSKRLSKGSGPTSVNGVNGDLLSTALVDGQVVEGEGRVVVKDSGALACMVCPLLDGFS